MIEKMIKIELTEGEHSLLIDALISARERWLEFAAIDTKERSSLSTIARLFALQCERTQRLIDKLTKD